MEIIYFASEHDRIEHARIMARARRVEFDISGRIECPECRQFHYSDEPHGKTTDRRKQPIHKTAASVTG